MGALRQYLDDKGISAGVFADWIGVSRQTVSAWTTGRKLPSPKHITLIAHRTRGEVGPEAWFPNVPSNGKSPRRKR